MEKWEAGKVHNIASQKISLPNITRFRKAQESREHKLRIILKEILKDIVGTRMSVWEKFLKLITNELEINIPHINLQNGHDRKDFHDYIWWNVTLERFPDIIVFAINHGHRYLPMDSENLHEKKARLYSRVEKILEKHKIELMDLMHHNPK